MEHDIPVGLTNRMAHNLVTDCPAVDKKVLLVRQASMMLRLADPAVQPIPSPLFVNLQCLSYKLPTDYRSKSVVILGSGQTQLATAIRAFTGLLVVGLTGLLKGKRDLAMRQAQTPDNLIDLCSLGALGF
jgi:hypothetical protein